MKILKILLITFTYLCSLSSLAGDYSYAQLKPGAKDDLMGLIENHNNFFTSTEKHFNLPIAYLRYNQSIDSVLQKYGPTSDINQPGDTLYKINGSYIPRMSLGSYGENYYQCVQFVKAVSDAGSGRYWKAGDDLQEGMYLFWRVIAKFLPDGTYDGTRGGHVAIAVAANSSGVYILDQNWEGNYNWDYGKIGLHLIPWSEAEKYSLVTKPN